MRPLDHLVADVKLARDHYRDWADLARTIDGKPCKSLAETHELLCVAYVALRAAAERMSPFTVRVGERDRN